jgi:NAD(P)-dependent dehydrogenase (short-subunit alcohol dehydrogenase family)
MTVSSDTAFTSSPDSRRGVAVVTGASGGLGRAIACELADRGYDVGLIARGRAGLEGAAADVGERGRRSCTAVADVAVWDEVDAAASHITDELGPIDVWVNNAMTTVFASVADTRPHELRRATEVTYLGQVHGAMAALDRMRLARCRHDPQRRFRAGVPRHPDAEFVLRIEVRSARLHGVVAQ